MDECVYMYIYVCLFVCVCLKIKEWKIVNGVVRIGGYVDMYIKYANEEFDFDGGETFYLS